MKSARVELESDDGKDENGEHDQQANLEDSISPTKLFEKCLPKSSRLFCKFLLILKSEIYEIRKRTGTEFDFSDFYTILRCSAA